MHVDQTPISDLIPYASNARTHSDRFEGKFIIGDGCWEWKSPTKNRYPTFSVNGKNLKAHRFSWMLYRGRIPDGIHVLHRCDNTKCVNPDHLFLGTHQDNMDDRKAKGRAFRGVGESNPNAKISELQAKYIKMLAIRGIVSQENIGAMFGISHGHVSRIKLNQSW